MNEDPLTQDDLTAIERRCEVASPSPWTASVEGRDHDSGDDVILIGHGDPDMYVTRDAAPASAADLDFIAHARQDVPRLVAEVRRLRGER